MLVSHCKTKKHKKATAALELMLERRRKDGLRVTGERSLLDGFLEFFQPKMQDLPLISAFQIYMTPQNDAKNDSAIHGRP